MQDTVSHTVRGAAEICKGDIHVMALSEREVERLLDPRALLDGLAEGFRALARGDVQSPPRPEIKVPGKGFLLPMPAWQEGLPITVKMVAVFEHNLERGLPNHLALITLFDPRTGMPICVMDGTFITGIRTAGSAVLSVRELARKDASIATVIGAGVQGREHVKLLPLVRDFDEIRVCSLVHEDAVRLARIEPRARAVEDVEAAVRDADVVCLASHSYRPVIEPGWARPGTHVSSVGFAPPAGELPVELAKAGHLFVEDKAAFEVPPVGCNELQGLDPASGTALGDMLLGRAAGRRSEKEVTVYKAMGLAMEDMVAATIVYERARRERAGASFVL
ncbi:MAG: ornithine cyclodeaminase family protein [Parvibaculaceae bacterium]